ncbi:hypothetical protein DKX38_029920 [Salix brachista]|uniref:Plant bHLH transcription factor ACT-like domain-containing protein n=1 Tax=Salix brachista TaxID=2182728 RepID=A0A5N5J1V5_9ROSI|nr:hypothetical protein DKX38_029920 [Salix brachista]
MIDQRVVGQFAKHGQYKKNVNKGDPPMHTHGRELIVDIKNEEEKMIWVNTTIYCDKTQLIFLFKQPVSHTNFGEGGGERGFMVSIEQEREAMFKKLQLLRSITNSHAHDKASVVLDASKYIKDLKQRVERLNQDIATAESFTGQNFPTIRVEEQEDDFLIKVFTTRNCQGLLVFILEAFEELGLEVLQATISTSDSFILEAIATRVRTQVETLCPIYPLTNGVCNNDCMRIRKLMTISMIESLNKWSCEGFKNGLKVASKNEARQLLAS